jgi:uncharacterized protein YicC (UPF0701 family)
VEVPTAAVSGAAGVVVGAMLDMFRVSRKFDRVLDKIDSCRTDVGQKIDGVAHDLDQKLDHLDDKIDRVARDLDQKIEAARAESHSDFRHLDHKIDGVTHGVASIGERVAVLETTAP